MKGDGRVFLRNKIWWISYYGPTANGTWGEMRESSRSTDEKVAARFLRRRRREVENDRAGIKTFIAPRRLRFNQIADDMLSDMKLRGLKSHRTATIQMEHARHHFGEAQADAVSSARLRDYQKARLEEGAMRATVDREVELVVRAFYLAHQENKVSQVPRVSRLLPKHGNARKGFVKPEDFDNILAGIRDPGLRDWLEFFWWTGMRDGEISSLTWEGFQDGTPPVLTLFRESAKTGEPRQVAVVGPLEQVMARRLRRRREGCEFIFHSNGKRFSRPQGGLKSWCYQEWKAACAKARLPADLRIYDLRRSAIRNLIHAGVSQATTMKISGHRTADTFRRYMVEDPEDTANAIMRSYEYVQNEKARRRRRPPPEHGHNTDKPGKK